MEVEVNGITYRQKEKVQKKVGAKLSPLPAAYLGLGGAMVSRKKSPPVPAINL